MMRNRLLRLGSAFLLAGLVSVAAADFTGPMFAVTASNESGTGTFEAPYDAQYYSQSSNTYSWSLPEQVEIRSQSGALIATLFSAVVFYVGDPLVSLAFAVGAGATTTHFAIQSSTLSFATIPNPQGQTSAGVTVTDVLGDGASYTGGLASGDSYRGVYNGFPGTLFYSMLPSYSVGANNSVTQNGTYGFVPVGAAVSDMTAEWNFDLSALDFAGGTSRYQIVPVPEPGTLLALSLGGLALIRKKKR